MIFLALSIVLTQAESCEARMSGAGAGLLGGGLGFMAGTMVASSVARNNRSYNSEPQAVYTTVDQRPIINHHYYNEPNTSDSVLDSTDSDDDSDYEYKVVRVKKS